MPAQHTPGPWQWIAEKDMIVGPKHRITWLDAHVSHANARLIAAAPELLEALDILIKVIDPPIRSPAALEPYFDSPLKQARAAIAAAQEATGKVTL